MKHLIFIALLAISLGMSAQDDLPASKQSLHFSIGQFPAIIATPSFSPLHLGLHTGLTHQWNNHAKTKLLQSANLGYFYHRDFQHAIQAYTEIGLQFNFGNGLALTPLALGGGYTMSISDMPTLNWDPTTSTYSQDKFPVRHNWMISLGTSLSYDTNLELLPGRKTTFFLDYRLQVQGTIISETVPVIAYTPIKIGVSIPLGTKE